jgi:ABC-2 type transport system ATP-binding protein
VDPQPSTRAAPVIEASALTKRYGSARGVDELTFEVSAGEVFGFLGPNGAGKTTTIRTMLDFIRPTSGTVRVLGMDPGLDGVAVRARVGYLPGELALYERLTGERYLRTFASLREGVEWAFATSLADRLALDLSRRIEDLSHGNKQKVGLVQAFMHRPDLLILDEPTQGLDPLVQQTFYLMLEQERSRGATVFLSSHVMPEVERVCDRVAIIREGRLVAVEDIGELKARATRRLELHLAAPAPAEEFAHLPSVRAVEAHGDTLTMSVEGPLDAVIKQAARYTVVNLQTREPSLEDLFLTYFDGDGHAPEERP